MDITEEQIQSIENFNLPVLQEAVRQAELLSKDENERKLRADTRCYSLLSINVILLSLILYITNNNVLNKLIHISFGISGIFMCISMIIFVKILSSYSYHGIGSYPSFWLRKEYLELEETRNKDYMLGFLLTYSLYHFENNIGVSPKSNEARLKMLNIAINILSISFIPLIISFGILIFNLITI